MWGNTIEIHNILKKKITKLNSNQLNIKKKINKDNFEKNHTKKKTQKRGKKNHVEKYCSNPQCFKEKNYKAKFSTNSILKKIKSTTIILEKKTKWRNTVAIHSVL